MIDVPDLRSSARRIFDVALSSVDAGAAMRRVVRLDGNHITIVDSTLDLERIEGGIYALAIGKAAFPMAVALDEILNERLAEGLVVGPLVSEYHERLVHPERKSGAAWQFIAGGHPLPTDASLVAARSAFELLQRANDSRALLLFLISGGGSAMIEMPRNPQTSLAELRAATRTLISCGANIEEINSVRRAFSTVKGGGLSSRAADTDQITLIISDTSNGRESTVASGPTFDPPLDAPDPSDVIARYKLEDSLPASILQAVTRKTEGRPKMQSDRLRQHYVLLDCDTAIEAAAEEATRLGFVSEIASEISEQPITDGCRLLQSRISELHSREKRSNQAVCLVSGGEFSCPVRGNGTGGRNSETALRLAIGLEERGQGTFENFAVLCAGTDGIDGNSPSAGAIVDESTIERATMRGLAATKSLECSDSYNFFNALGDAITIGSTGTNVRDLRIILAV